MKYLYVLRGAPGCGKSTFIEQNNLEDYTISPDTLRMQMGSSWWTLDGIGINQSMNKKLFEDYFYPMLEERMRKGELVFVDATASTVKEIKSYQKLCKKYGYYMRIVDFTSVEPSLCKLRNSQRKPYKRVPEQVIDKMYERFKSKKVPSSIKVIPYDEFDVHEELELKPLDFSKYDELFFIGDIHGCFDTFKNEVLPNAGNNAAYIFIGDYFDRGNQQKEMYNWIVEHMDKPNYYFLIGNHEARIRQWLRTGKLQSGAFKDTIDKIGATKKQWRRFYYHLLPVLYIKYGMHRFIVTHGGLSDDRQISKCTASYQFVHGIGGYNDVESACKSFDKGIFVNYQIFGHRYYSKTQIGDRNFCLCGNPEQNGTIRWLKVFDPDSKDLWCLDGEAKTNFYDHDSFVKEFEKNPETLTEQMTNQIYVDLYRSCEFVKERKMKNSNISSFNFTKDAFYDKNWNGITTRARGLFVNTNTNEIVARSYNKFFLLNEHPESSEEYIRKNYKFPVYCYRKYDGYLCILGYDRESDELVFTSKSIVAGQNNVSSEYADYFKKVLINNIGLDINHMKEWFKKHDVSFVFETVAPKFDPHLIQYNDYLQNESEHIILLDVIHNDFEYKPVSVEYDSYEDYLNYLSDITRELANLTTTSIGYRRKMHPKELRRMYDNADDLFNDIPNLKAENGEGYVFCDKEGRMFKLKTYKYEALKAMRNLFYNHIKVRQFITDKKRYFASAYPYFTYRQLACIEEYYDKLTSTPMRSWYRENASIPMDALFYKNPHGYKLAEYIVSRYKFD